MDVFDERFQKFKDEEVGENSLSTTKAKAHISYLLKIEMDSGYILISSSLFNLPNQRGDSTTYSMHD